MSAIHVFPLMNRPKQTRPGRRKKVAPGASNSTTAGRRTRGSGSPGHSAQDVGEGSLGVASSAQGGPEEPPVETGPIRRVTRIRQTRVRVQGHPDPNGYYNWWNEQMSPTSTDNNFPTTPHSSTSSTPSASSPVQTRRNAVSGSPLDMTFSGYDNTIPPATDNAIALGAAHSWPSVDPSSHFGQHHVDNAWMGGVGNEVPFSSYPSGGPPFNSRSSISHTVSDSELLARNFYNNRPNHTFVQYASFPSSSQVTQYSGIPPPPHTSYPEFVPTTGATVNAWDTGGLVSFQQPSYAQAARCFSSQAPTYSDDLLGNSGDLEPLSFSFSNLVLPDVASGTAPTTQDDPFSQTELGFVRYGQLSYDAPHALFQPDVFAQPDQ